MAEIQITKPKHNLSRKNRQALKELRQNTGARHRHQAVKGITTVDTNLTYMFLTRTPRQTRIKSHFPWISPRFSVIFTRLTRITQTKFPFPSSKFPLNLPR